MKCFFSFVFDKDTGGAATGDGDRENDIGFTVVVTTVPSSALENRFTNEGSSESTDAALSSPESSAASSSVFENKWKT